VDEHLDPDVRSAVIEHVLADVYPDRREAEIVDAAPLRGGYRVGVKAPPKGYISTAKYALVTVEDGRIVAADPCSGKALRRELAALEED